MKIFRDFGHGKYIRPTILELGGKNPAIVSRNADLEDAAIGIVRSAFGLQGQKCSACSRVFIEAPVYDQLASRLVELTNKMMIGDPTDAQCLSGTGGEQEPPIGIISVSSGELAQAGKILTGGKVLTEGELCQRLLLRAHPGGTAAGSPLVEGGDVPADHHHCPGGEPG